MIRSIFKPSRNRNGKRVRSRIYWGQYRIDPDDPITRVSLQTADKRVAEKRLDEIVSEIEQERAGVIAPRSFRSASSKPVVDHVDDFLADLKTRGRSKEYTRKVNSRLHKLIDECAWGSLSDVSADSFITWRSMAKQSPRTLNHYLDAAQVLMGWLVDGGRVPENPLNGVQKVDTRGRETFERRAFSDDEIRRLIAVSGPRAAIYSLAVQTGLRFSEMRSLRWGDVKIRNSDQVSVITLRALTTKNRRADVIPLSSGAVNAIQSLLSNPLDPSATVFSNGMPSHHTVTADLERAQIPKVDELGRRVDFHALRTTFITNLQRAGVKRRVAMALARHSDSRLTDGVYTDVEALPFAQALAQLPRIDWVDDPECGQLDDAQIDAQELVSGCHSVSLNSTASRADSDSQITEKTWACDEKTCQSGTHHDGLKKWSRGESNPRTFGLAAA